MRLTPDISFDNVVILVSAINHFAFILLKSVLLWTYANTHIHNSNNSPGIRGEALINHSNVAELPGIIYLSKVKKHCGLFFPPKMWKFEIKSLVD